MDKKLALGTLFCTSVTIMFLGCSEVPTAESKSQTTAPEISTEADPLPFPGGPVVLRDLKMTQSIDGSEVRMSCEVDWVEREDGSRRIVIDGAAGSTGKKQISLYDMELNLKWRMGWDTIGADSYMFQETESERLETLIALRPNNHWQETYTHTVGEDVRQLVLVYDEDSAQDRAEARREYLGFMPQDSTLDHNAEGERLVFLLQDAAFYAAVQRAKGEEPEDLPETTEGVSGDTEVACDLLRQCTSIACADDNSSPACLICVTGTFICWVFGE